jgi:hypothetical protein
MTRMQMAMSGLGVGWSGIVPGKSQVKTKRNHCSDFPMGHYCLV